MATNRTGRQLLRDYCIYLLVGLSFFSSAVWFGIHRVQFDMRWLGLAACTAVTFGYPLKFQRRKDRSVCFWVAFIVAASIHVAAFSFLILHTDRFGLVVFAIASPLEWVFIRPLFGWAGRVRLWGSNHPAKNETPKRT
jgi:hypothetical protein